MVHVGIGYDVHAFASGRKLVLGGVEIPHRQGLAGHSDADVLMHAICDALLGAIGEADIGSFFPDSDARWRNARSSVFLEKAAELVAGRGGKIINVDATIIAESPRMMAHVPAMKQNVGAALRIGVRAIGIKATTNERLGFVGRGEGIAALAVAGVDLP